MKKVFSLLVALAMCLSLCACGASLTEEQKSACEKADGLLELISSDVPGSTYESRIKTIDGKTLYVGTLDVNGTFDAINAFQNSVMPVLEGTFSECGIDVVLYIKENGKDMYRIIDSGLDPSILD